MNGPLYLLYILIGIGTFVASYENFEFNEEDGL
jgi:hypothetical protein